MFPVKTIGKVCVFVALLWALISATPQRAQAPVTFFHGTKVNIVAPQISSDEERFPMGPAILCLASTPVQQCYTPPKHDPPFDSNPIAQVIRLKPGFDAIMFEVQATAGGSGTTHLLALLEPGKGKYLNDLLFGITFGDQSEHHFWSVPSVSDMPLLVIADAMGGAGETHFSRHRFVVKVFAFDPKLRYYGLQDEYLTSGKYPSFDEVDVISVLESERQEILTRLKKQH